MAVRKDTCGVHGTLKEDKIFQETVSGAEQSPGKCSGQKQGSNCQELSGSHTLLSYLKLTVVYKCTYQQTGTYHGMSLTYVIRNSYVQVNKT